MRQPPPFSNTQGVCVFVALSEDLITVDIDIPLTLPVAGTSSFTVSCNVVLPERFIYLPTIRWSHDEVGESSIPADSSNRISATMTGDFSAELTFSPVTVNDTSTYYCIVSVGVFNVRAARQYHHTVSSK